MKRVIALGLSLAVLPCLAQEQEIHRALIQRDQQSAEFAARVRGADTARLEQLHADQLRDASRPLVPDAEVSRQLLPYQRERMTRERELVLPPPIVRAKPSEPALALPGGPSHAVDPIPVQGGRN